MKYEYLLGLTLLASIGVVVLIVLFTVLLKNKIDYFLYVMKNNKEFKKNNSEREQMLKKGEVHEWIKVVVGLNEVLACKKTGWCPSLSVYFTSNFMKDWEQRHKTIKEYDRYRDKKISELAKENNFSISDFETLVEKIFKIKKDFYLEKMAIEGLKETINDK